MQILPEEKGDFKAFSVKKSRRPLQINTFEHQVQDESENEDYSKYEKKRGKSFADVLS